jgi:DNA-directed RNA polymerase specialized sigma24 family protein
VPDVESRLKNLMLLSLAGDGTAYRELLLELSVHLRAYYRKRLGWGSSDAEDLVQETLMAIDARRATFDRTGHMPWRVISSLTTYGDRACVSQCLWTIARSFLRWTRLSRPWRRAMSTAFYPDCQEP